MAAQWRDRLNAEAGLPEATYPVRDGLHANSAFGLSRALPYARMRARQAHPGLPRRRPPARRSVLSQVSTDDYMVTHWLAAYAVLLLGEDARAPR